MQDFVFCHRRMCNAGCFMWIGACLFSGQLVADDGIGQRVFVYHLQKPDLGLVKNRFQVATGGDNAAVIDSIEAFGNIKIRFGFAYHITQVNH